MSTIIPYVYFDFKTVLKPFRCGYCYTQASYMGEELIKTSCDHQFHPDCLARFRNLTKRKCPQCYFGDKTYQCSHCGLPVSSTNKNFFQRSCECVSHRTCLKKQLDFGITKCQGCKNEQDLDPIDKDNIERILIKTKFIDCPNWLMNVFMYWLIYCA